MPQSNQSSPSQPGADLATKILNHLAKKYGTSSETREPIQATIPAPQTAERPINVDSQAVINALSAKYKARNSETSTVTAVKRLHGV